MRTPRNPFAMRASENIIPETDFLRLFAGGVIELLPRDDAWNKVHFFVSAPGGGKTSLFRVLSPQSLIALHSFQSNEQYKDLYERLKDYGVFSNQGPSLLGIPLSCVRNYAAIEDLELSPAQKHKLFLSLFYARIILSALKSALTLKGLRYPEDLKRISFEGSFDSTYIESIFGSTNGYLVVENSKKVEREICNAIDSFSQINVENLVGHHDLNSLAILKPGIMKIDGKSVSEQVAVLIDDFHMLTKKQRELLTRTLIDLRLPIGIWIAERLEAQEPTELVSLEIRNGREFNLVNLENYWRKGNSKKFENMLWNIADLRIRSIPEIQARVPSFKSSIDFTFSSPKYIDRVAEINSAIQSRVINKYENSSYQDWIDELKLASGSHYDLAIQWRSLEILIERNVARGQKTLFGLPASEAELENLKDSQIKAAAEFFISREYEIPYYFGPSRLASLSSSNIEQFLFFASKLFEVVLASGKLNSPLKVESKTQETLLKNASDGMWNSLSKRISNGYEVKWVLTQIRDLLLKETNKPNAPYAPGATGIAISMEEKEKLVSSRYGKLLKILTTCISNNLLEPVFNVKQGGKKWLVLYLNRALCLHFGLPLQYGGWRPRRISELSQWIDSTPPVDKAGGAML